jgi:hypothetical protein
VSDAEELRLQRKQRQTEGLGLWAEQTEGYADEDTKRILFGNPDAPNEFSSKVNVYTTHPDSVAGQSQAGLILRHLQSGATLTALDALDLFGCNRLAARIADLRAKGYRVQSTLIELPNGKRVASYALLDK